MRLRVLGIVLAGGKGTRLFPLTKERAKPAVPFGGKYRIVDFVLSNFINSGLYSIYVLTQFRPVAAPAPLRRLAVRRGPEGPLHHPRWAQMRSADETWYQDGGRHLPERELIEQSNPTWSRFGADHIYR